MEKYMIVLITFLARVNHSLIESPSIKLYHIGLLRCVKKNSINNISIKWVVLHTDGQISNYI